MTMTDSRILDDRALDILFREARSYNGWKDEPVSDVLLHALFDLLKMGPTSANSSPANLFNTVSPTPSIFSWLKRATWI